MSGKHTSLIRRGWRDEEVEWLECAFDIAGLSAASVFYKATVDDTTTWWVVQLTANLISQEEALIDALIHHDEGNLGVGSFLRVELANSLLKLSDLDIDDGLSLCIAHSITEDHKVGWHRLTLMLLFESFNSEFQSLLELGVDYLLSTLLHQILRVVLGHRWICRG